MFQAVIAHLAMGELNAKGFMITPFDSESKLGTAPYLEPREDNWHNPRNLQPNLHACQQQCLRVPACKYGTYIIAGVRNKECWLAKSTSDTPSKCGVPCKSFKKTTANAPPQIKLHGRNPQIVGVDPNAPLYYADPGASCFDTKDGDISSKITVHFGDIAEEGDHKVIYVCTNSAGVSSVLSRRVKTTLVTNSEKVIKLQALLPISASVAFTQHGEPLLQAAVSQALGLSSPSDVEIRETSDWDEELLVSMHLHVRGAGVGGHDGEAWRHANSKTSQVMEKLSKKQQFVAGVLQALSAEHMGKDITSIFDKVKFSNARMIHHQVQAAADQPGSSSQTSAGSSEFVTGAFILIAVVVLGCMGMLFVQQMGSVTKFTNRSKIGLDKRNRSLQSAADTVEEEDSFLDELPPKPRFKQEYANVQGVDC